MATAVKGATKKKSAEKVNSEIEEIDYSLNDVLLRGRVSAEATSKELPSGDKVVEFRLIITREEREGVDTLDTLPGAPNPERLRWRCSQMNGSRSQVQFIEGSGRAQQGLPAVGRL